MNTKTLWAILAYLVSVAVLLSFVYWFLINEGFTENNFLIAAVVTLLLATGWGYIISTYLLAPKLQQDENLSKLISEILHELNIPISTIKANTSLLRKGAKDEKSLQRLNRIESSSNRLERLYKELIYSIKKEIHPIEKEIFSLNALLQERIEVFEAFGRHRFEITVEESALKADKIGFEKMIDNVVMNAMKYSEKESLISIMLENYTLTIADKGIGMDETQLLRVYERYYQGDSKREGEGIGLALVKAYCDEEEIDIQIESQKEKGTSVLLNLKNIIYTP